MPVKHQLPIICPIPYCLTEETFLSALHFPSQFHGNQAAMSGVSCDISRRRSFLAGQNGHSSLAGADHVMGLPLAASSKGTTSSCSAGNSGSADGGTKTLSSLAISLRPSGSIYSLNSYLATPIASSPTVPSATTTTLPSSPVSSASWTPPGLIHPSSWAWPGSVSAAAPTDRYSRVCSINQEFTFPALSSCPVGIEVPVAVCSDSLTRLLTLPGPAKNQYASEPFTFLGSFEWTASPHFLHVCPPYVLAVSHEN
ncbi:unnamed protein product [Protopolystoma xenopodis]|uniref:Uncharacterized protein n=1 Tax=Protopolystoma xenopodis TaxID=117903 RepID=A0A448X1Y1_9PLAT|nr:unnamed protein product [Protopolystoma xenopodis]